MLIILLFFFFFFNDTATTEIYTLSLHDALPIFIISLVGSRSNRDGFGARVTVNGQSGYATSAGSYLSANDKRLHFGLGPAREARVEIHWPSGRIQALERVSADRVLTVREP